VTYYFDHDPPPEPSADSVEPNATGEISPPVAHQRRAWRYTFLAPWEEPEVDRYEELSAARDQRWTGRSIILATVALAVFNAASITSWASTLPPNWGTETIRLVARVWDERLAQMGLDQPRAAVRKAYEAQKAKRW
jgi:hypothetical protein